MSLSTTLSFEVDKFGYIEPGHGLKGRQQWLVQDEDLDNMYTSYGKRFEVLLWCILLQSEKNTQRKRSNESEANKPPKRTCSTQIQEVEDIVSQLSEKHGDKYTSEQLSCWAHMYNLSKHRSLEVLPDLPHFSGHKEKELLMFQNLW